ncbi:MAG TPA: PLP-dependent transferase [Acidimicrobiales bacterium]|nr:PLP-dependent transferase [Acidimicrobiales bacterium]
MLSWDEGLDPSTIAIHLGRPAAEPGAPVSPPMALTATYHEGGEDTYGRDSNATWTAFEEVLGGLEGGEALAFASGMAAISAVVESVPIGGGVVVAADAYQGTRLLLQDLAGRGRLTLRTVDVADTDATLAGCAEVAGAGDPRGGPGEFGAGGLLWVESPTNPLLAVADLAALSAGAHELGLSVAADNTLATPILQRPLELGVDVVVHSVTKLLSGHSDVVMGAAVSRDPAITATLTRRRSLTGAIPGPFETLLALRGVRTLAVRIERSQATAAELANRLSVRKGVAGVRYPGLAHHLGHERARRQMRGFGTMLAFELVGGASAADAVCHATRLITAGTSLGGVESLMERRGRYPAEHHLPASLLRLSVGLEHVEDLWADLDGAMTSAGF